MSTTITTAMVLAAGYGRRMRPLTDLVPKPLVPLAGRSLIDHALDRLGEAGIQLAVVNVHHLADLIEAHLAGRERPAIAISDERERLLDTGGGITKALPLLGSAPFLVHNSDSVWLEPGDGQPSAGQPGNVERLLRGWNCASMDCLLLLAPAADCLGYSGLGDYDLAADGHLRSRPEGQSAAYVFTGVSIAHPRLLVGTPDGPFSLTWAWNRAITAGRAYGLLLHGRWMHVGDPSALAAAEQAVAAHGGKAP